RRLPRGGRGRRRGPVRRPGRRRRRPDPACGGRPPCGRRSPASGSCRSGEPVPAGAAAMALLGGAPCAGITAGGAADPGGLPDAALLLGRVDQFPLTELLEFVLEHGVAPRTVSRWISLSAMPPPSSPRGVRHIGRLPHLPRHRG